MSSDQFTQFLTTALSICASHFRNVAIAYVFMDWRHMAELLTAGKVAFDELLNGEIFYSLKEAQTIVEEWRRHYNTKRPHSALGYKTPAPESIIHLHQRPIMN